MKIHLRFFASVRETLGLASETIDVSEQTDSVGAVRHFLIARGGAWATALGEQRALRMAYDQQMANADTRVADGGEIAFFPPVTGG